VPDNSRLRRSIEKIGRGLYFHHAGTPVPPERPCVATVWFGHQRLSRELRELLPGLTCT
jgi:hypothetical protein